MRRILLYFLFVFSGCLTVNFQGAYAAPSVKAPPLQSEVVVKQDKFSNSVGFMGIQESHDEYLELPQRYFLTSTLLKDTQTVEHFLTVFHTYEAYSMIRYETARTQDAQDLGLTVIKREVSSCNAYSDKCSYSEIVAAIIPESVLKQYEQIGFEVKLYGKTNSKVIKITPHQITAQLKAINRNIDILNGTIKIPNYKPLYSPGATYPRRALERGITGFVKLRYDITKEGKPVNIRVIESSPPGVFDEAAIESVKQSTYETEGYIEGAGIEITFDLGK